MEVSDLSDHRNKIVSQIAESHGFKDLKETQKQAFQEGILDEGNHLLVAETGNGKTLCAEAVVKKHIEKDNQVAYLVPSKQLVKSKKESIKEWVGDEVEVATGSGKYHHGDVIVASFSSFYQAILRGVGNSRSLDLAVLDDFHELYGSFIGPGLEKSIAAAKQYDIELFAMSATIGNPKEISNWLDASLIESNQERSIPISEDTVGYGSSKKQSLIDLTSQISDEKPVLIFNYAKSWTESRAKGISDAEIFTGPSIDVQSKMSELVDGSIPPSIEDLPKMIENGVAYHHSSIPKSIRQWIENLFKERKIKCLCATTTIAYGFDSPVQSVIVADIKRRGEWVGTWEYQQWIGRSARPGYGYDKGYSYTLTNSEREVKERFFEPRELEPIETHIEDESEFRKLILELIVMGWETPEEIESFVRETLYWSQLSTKGAWGKSFGTQEKRLERKLRSTVDWLENNGFIREDRTTKKFSNTDIGEGAVEFIFSSNISPSLSDIRNLYSWSESKNQCSRLELLGKICEIFDLGVRQKRSSTHIESTIRDNGLNVNRHTISAAVLHEYWAENYPTDQMEKETQVNSAYLESSTYRISTTLESSKNITKNTRMHIPSWMDTYSYRIKRGIKYDEVPYIRNVRGLGRERIRSLKLFLNDKFNEDGTMWEYMEKWLKKSSEKEIVDEISSEIDGIGTSIGHHLIEFHQDDHIAKTFRQKNESKTTGLGSF